MSLQIRRKYLKMAEAEEQRSLLQQQLEANSNNNSEEQQGEAVETWKSWLVVLAAFFSIGLLDGSMYSNSIIFINLQLVQDLDESEKSNMKWVLAGQVLVSSITATAAASLTSWMGPRAVGAGGAFLAAAGWALTTFASELGLLIFFQTFMVGSGYGLMYIPGTSLQMSCANIGFWAV